MDAEACAFKTPQSAISPVVAEPGEFYFVPSSMRKSVWTFVRQLRGPHLSTCAWCSSRSSNAVTAAGIAEQLTPVVDRSV
jgi:hypothetical protein